jgi:cob(I)alamin adenosyltransferase
MSSDSKNTGVHFKRSLSVKSRPKSVFNKNTLHSGLVVNKYDATYDMIGHIDILISSIGVVRATATSTGLLKSGNPTIIKNIEYLVDIQIYLKTIMDAVASYNNSAAPKFILEQHVIHTVDSNTNTLKNSIPPKTHSIIPGSSLTEAHLMVARSHCKLLEKVLWNNKSQYDVPEINIKYINRLEKFFKILACVVLKVEGKTPKRFTL